MRVAVVAMACGLVLVACSGGAAVRSAAAPSAAAAASAAPSVAVATPEPTIAVASVAPAATVAPENCMAARAYDLLIKPSTDWKTVSPGDREFTAVALEAYDFSGGEGFNPDYVALLVKQLRKPGTDLVELAPFALWAGQITIVSCG